MKLKVPFLNTSAATDLLLGFMLTPLWWVTGFNIFCYHLIAFWAFSKMIMSIMKNNESLKIPKPFFVFFIFLLSYLLSILLNISIRLSQRIFASLNNYTTIIMAFFIMAAAVNTAGRPFLKLLVKWGSRLCIFTAIIGFLILLFWLKGYKNLQVPTLLYRFLPSLIEYPYFFMLLKITGTVPDEFKLDLPRLTIYSSVATSTGGLMLGLIPLMIARFQLKKRIGVFFSLCLTLALLVLVFTIARAAIFAFIAAFIIVTLLSKGGKTAFVFISSMMLLITSGAAYRLFDWIFNVRKASTTGRMNLYEEALRILFEENPLFGVGVRMRDGFTMMAIGSHSLYIEIVFVAGLVGLSLFLLFQFLVLKYWFDQRKILRNEPEKIIWKYLGMAYIGMSIWLVTDTLFGPPFTPYLYFLIISAVFIFGRFLKKEEVPESFI